MPALEIDPHSSVWLAVRAYAQARIEQLKTDAISATATDDQRREAAYRAAELIELIAAPRRAVELARDRVTEVRSTY